MTPTPTDSHSTLAAEYLFHNCHFSLHLSFSSLGTIKLSLQSESVHNILNYIPVNFSIEIIFPFAVSSPH